MTWIKLTNLCSTNLEMSWGTFDPGQWHNMESCDLSMADAARIVSGEVVSEIANEHERCSWVDQPIKRGGMGLTQNGDQLDIELDHDSGLQIGGGGLALSKLKDSNITGPWFDGMKRIMVDQALTLAAQKGNLGTGTLVEKACELLGFKLGTEEAGAVQKQFEEEWEVEEELEEDLRSVAERMREEGDECLEKLAHAAETTTSTEQDPASAPTSPERSIVT